VSPGALRGESKRKAAHVYRDTRRSLTACRHFRYGPSSGPASPQLTVPVPLEPGTPRWAATAQSVILLHCLY